MKTSSIIAAVAKAWGVKQADIVGPKRIKTIVEPRQAAYLLARKHTPQSFPAIARQFGGRDHTTVIDGVARAERRCQENPDFRQLLMKAESALIEEREAAPMFFSRRGRLGTFSSVRAQEAPQ